MKTPFALFLSTAGLLHAGTPDLESTLAAKPEPWIKPVIDIRARYEFGDVDAFDPSHALTVRERLGLKTKAWNGFSALIEGEFSQAVIDDYNGGAGPTADPFDPANTAIFDPETNELNQAFLQYEGFDTTAKIGRQRLIYDNAAFIGNVGWRQNEQTYDGITLANKSIDGLTLNYGYINQVNRIFGSDADSEIGFLPGFANVQDLQSEIHLLNASYTGFGGVTLGGYAYIMNFEELGAWDNNTFGASAKGTLGGVVLYGELAFQDKAGVLGEQDALYGHATATKTFGKQSLTVGLEHLDAGFKTPLATVHAFNGFADVTDGARLSGAHNGLTDLYVSHTIPLFYGIKWTNVLHAMGDNEISSGYGWEYDSVLTKKFDDNFTAIAKFAQFESEGDAYVGPSGSPGLPTATRVSIELDYTF
ncbi:alginate export family protein [Luteolibacter yonseiensis]|uniref:Alginate export family protein n=1 Tax=Luteolibacter yonseiensis TaxID=1144680 RepID=A0A934R630_9BACT|nr:alginate export family protein [Luteolibacter yonseiensis]MBK1817634.1 alginate export family protein [Luteolibacter yonseiensis]